MNCLWGKSFLLVFILLSPWRLAAQGTRETLQVSVVDELGGILAFANVTLAEGGTGNRNVES